MKKVILFLSAAFIASGAFAQAPNLMSYQAVIWNNNSILVSNTTVGMRISILYGSNTGPASYVETQTPTTNANGLVSLQIGAGTVVSGQLDTINWGGGYYYIKTETDPTGGANYSITGTSQLLSVPYALYAGNAPVNGWSLTGNSGTNSSVNFAGTTDSNSFAIGTNDTARVVVDPSGNINALGHTIYNIADLQDNQSTSSVNVQSRVLDDEFGTHAVLWGNGNNALRYGGNTMFDWQTLTMPPLGGNGAGFVAVDNAGNLSWAAANIGTVNGTGTANYLTKWITADSILGNSLIYDNGTRVGIGTTSPAAFLDIEGNTKIADGTQGAGKVLTSDANGVASWKPAAAIAYGVVDSNFTGPGAYGIASVTNPSVGNYVITCTNTLPGNATMICTWWDTNGYGFISCYQSGGGNDVSVTLRNSAGVNVEAVFSIAIFGN